MLHSKLPELKITFFLFYAKIKDRVHIISFSNKLTDLLGKNKCLPHAEYQSPCRYGSLNLNVAISEIVSLDSF
jgi:hypothetical protein